MLARESQLKQLSRELQMVQSSSDQVREEIGRGAEEVTRLERELRAQHWEKEDEVNAREARIAELEGQLAHAQSRLKTTQGDFERRLRCSLMPRKPKYSSVPPSLPPSLHSH